MLSTYPINVNNFASLRYSKPIGGESNSLMTQHNASYLSWFGRDLLVSCLVTRGSFGCFRLLRYFSDGF